MTRSVCSKSGRRKLGTGRDGSAVLVMRASLRWRASRREHRGHTPDETVVACLGDSPGPDAIIIAQSRPVWARSARPPTPQDGGLALALRRILVISREHR